MCRSKNFAKQFSLLLIGCSIFTLANSQSDKRLVMADQYFSAGEYYTAASLYGQFLTAAGKQKSTSDFPLNSRKHGQGRAGRYGSKTDIQYKQAESYRLSNYWEQASALYKDCFHKDSVKYASALYWYAVCQRSMGNYAAAEESLNRFLNEFSNGNTDQEAAKKEKEILQFIKAQVTRPDSVLYHVQKVDASSITQGGVYAPVTDKENNLLITGTQTDSIRKPGINPNHNRIFRTVLVNGNFQSMEPVVIEGIDSTRSQGTASLSSNGNYIYFTQWSKETGQAVSSIYYSTKKGNGWSQPVALTSVNQAGHNSKQPFCSADGKYLFFASDREGGKGNFDIWFAPLKGDGTTGEPVNAGAINTPGNEQAPFYHNASNMLVFSSDRMPGMGGYDLYISKGRETTWKAPENLGYPINSSRDDIYFFASEKGNVLDDALISSDRGSECCLATYAVSKTAKKRMVTGVVRDCNDNTPIANAEVTMKDASGKTWQVTSDEDGKYMFELAGNDNGRLFSLNKEKYTDTTARMTITGSNEKGWFVDTLYNAPLCVQKKLVIKVENVVTVYFEFNKSKLGDEAAQKLDSVYNILMQDTTLKIQVSGYTDGLGSAKYNKILSDKRAKSCADYLIKKGVNRNRIGFESFGACCPVEMELINGRDNADGRGKNRRALINIDR